MLSPEHIDAYEELAEWCKSLGARTAEHRMDPSAALSLIAHIREQAEALAEARPLVEGALCNCFSTPHFDTCNYVRATEWLARHFVAAHPAPTNPRETR